MTVNRKTFIMVHINRTRRTRVMPKVTQNLLRFVNGKDNGGYDPIEAVKEQGITVVTVVTEYPERADEIIMACIDAHGLKWIDALDDKFLSTEAVSRHISRYKLTTPLERQE